MFSRHPGQFPLSQEDGVALVPVPCPVGPQLGILSSPVLEASSEL